MIKPLPGRVLVEILPRYLAAESKLNLTIVDKKKHFEGSRKGRVLGVGDFVRDVQSGDVVWFEGPRGKSFSRNSAGFNDGTDMRVLRASDILAVEELAAA